MSAADLLQALVTPEDVWEAAESEREAQARRQTFLTKWLPIWRQWGHTMPGYEHLLETP